MDGWIFCGGNRRCGTTLHYHLVREIVEYAGIGRGMGALSASAVAANAKWTLPEYRKQAPNQLRVVKCHLLLDSVKKALRKPNARACYIYRDPRDAFASTQAHDKHVPVLARTGLWAEGFLVRDRAWRDQPNLLVTRYEDMIVNVPTEVERLAEWLEVKIHARFSQELAEKYTIERVKSEAVYSAVTDTGWAVAQGGQRPFFTDHVTSSGEWGEYRTRLTAEQIVAIEQVASGWLAARGYSV